jgi:hypothetical protein
MENGGKGLCTLNLVAGCNLIAQGKDAFPLGKVITKQDGPHSGT